MKELSKQLKGSIEQEIMHQNMARDAARSIYAAKDSDIIRRSNHTYSVYRRGYTRECEAIINLRQFVRYTNKTQVFSLYKNNDISNRSYHVQLVSRIARTIGEALGLNTGLIEAVALGHDLGHTPFGHIGEEILNKLTAPYGYCFKHHYQSARYLTRIVDCDIALQVADGILGHNGEILRQCYQPNLQAVRSFAEFDKKLDDCFAGKAQDAMLTPSTLEGCLVRISDVIAYLGKDRQDAERLGIEHTYPPNPLGAQNHEFIKNLTRDIINTSYGKNYIGMSDEVYQALQQLMKDNYKTIYFDGTVKQNHALLPAIFKRVFEFLLDDLKNGDMQIVRKLYLNHLDYQSEETKKRYLCEAEAHPYRIAADFIAAMCDDYFVSFYRYFLQDKAQEDKTLTFNDYRFD